MVGLAPPRRVQPGRPGILTAKPPASPPPAPPAPPPPPTAFGLEIGTGVSDIDREAAVAVLLDHAAFDGHGIGAHDGASTPRTATLVA